MDIAGFDCLVVVTGSLSPRKIGLSVLFAEDKVFFGNELIFFVHQATASRELDDVFLVVEIGFHRFDVGREGAIG